MNRSIFSAAMIVISLFIASGCGKSSPILNTSQSPYSRAPSSGIPFATSSLSPTFTVPGIPALVKTSLLFYRNGKTYEIVVGYALGPAFFYATPRPEIPQQVVDTPASSASLEWYGDIVKDGEIEYIVSLIYVGVSASEEIRLYKYNPNNDRYDVADSIGSGRLVLNQIIDLDHDGNPEIITENFGFCFQCSDATLAWSAITIMRYEQGRFRDRTIEFPDLLLKDADKFLAASKTNANNQNGGYITAASYLYDMYRLGKLDEAIPVFNQTCLTVIKPNVSWPSFDCDQYRADVVSAMKDFRAHP